LTLAGLFGALLAFTGYVLCRSYSVYLLLASFGLGLNWLGDSLDGTLARTRHIERPRYGFFLDHSTDIVSQVLIGLGLGISPFVRFDVACLALVAYLALAALSFVKKSVSGSLQIAYLNIGPTETRCALICLNTVLLWYRPQPIMTLLGSLSPVDIGILGTCLCASMVFTVTVFREARKLSLDDR